MSLKTQITDDMKTAMRAKDKERLATIRLIQAAIKQREVDERIELNDEQVLQILNKMIKQRRDSITQYTAGDRKDLADKEAAEIETIITYLPAQLNEDEIAQEVTQAITDSGAAGPKDMGKVMGALKGKLQGKADMGLVSKLVKEKLAG